MSVASVAALPRVYRINDNEYRLGEFTNGDIRILVQAMYDRDRVTLRENGDLIDPKEKKILSTRVIHRNYTDVEIIDFSFTSDGRVLALYLLAKHHQDVTQDQVNEWLVDGALADALWWAWGIDPDAVRQSISELAKARAEDNQAAEVDAKKNSTPSET